MMFKQDQETLMVDEVVSDEADDRQSAYSHQSDGMQTRDGVLQNDTRMLQR